MTINKLTDEQIRTRIEALKNAAGDSLCSTYALDARLLEELLTLRDLSARAKALMYQSGGAPVENSLNPIDAFLFDAERAELQEYRKAPACSPLLKSFYLAYSAWLAGGTQDSYVFNRGLGLCASAYDFFKWIGIDSKAPLEEMHAAFVAAGLDEKLPFNESPEHYHAEQERRECHSNPARAAWVKRYAAPCAELQEYRKASQHPVAWTDAEELRDLERDGCGAMLALNHKCCEHADPRRQIALFTAPKPLTDAERAELQEYRKALPAGYHVIKECGAVGCSLATLEEAENTRDFWNKNWTIKPYFYGPQPRHTTETVYQVQHGQLWRDLDKVQYDDHVSHGAEGLRILYTAPQSALPGGWMAVPIEPTEDMIIQGFESEPNESFSDSEEWEKYQEMSGCEQAAHRAKLCWAAMLAAVPKQGAGNDK